MTSDTVLIVRIAISDEGDHFYAYSPDVPGLHVNGTSVEQARERVTQVLPELFKANRGFDVMVASVSEDVDGYIAGRISDHHLALQRIPERLAA